MSRIFFTSDTHFSHANVIKYCNRPFMNFPNTESARVMEELYLKNQKPGPDTDDTIAKLAMELRISPNQVQQIRRENIRRMVNEMDEELIRRWNSVVSPMDLLYHTGDFSFADEKRTAQILDRLNGTKILIYGNHDEKIKGDSRNGTAGSSLLQSKFDKCVDALEIHVKDADARHGEQLIVMSHYAHLVWNKSHRGSWMIHGHSHGDLKYPIEGKILDVGSDAHNFTPISYEEVKAMMSKKRTQAVDHHV